MVTVTERIKMATKAYTVETIELQGYLDENGDEKLITIHPLVISKFRQLAEILDALMNPKEDEERSVLDVYLEAVAFCMETFEPELSDPKVLENHVDMPTLEHILDVVAGVRLNDPNLQAAMAATSGKN
jgi:hypothetical protein